LAFIYSNIGEKSATSAVHYKEGEPDTSDSDSSTEYSTSEAETPAASPPRSHQQLLRSSRASTSIRAHRHIPRELRHRPQPSSATRARRTLFMPDNTNDPAVVFAFSNT
ncbi:hypothetical protein F443_08842, partial [Phytophthora nicotianae P1569]